MAKEAWGRITTGTIVNYYRRASFVKEDGAGAADSAPNATGETGVDLPASVTADELSRYVAVDSDRPIAADSTDDEICAQVQGSADDGEGSRMTRRSTQPAAQRVVLMTAARRPPSPTTQFAACALFGLI